MALEIIRVAMPPRERGGLMARATACCAPSRARCGAQSAWRVRLGGTRSGKNTFEWTRAVKLRCEQTLTPMGACSGQLQGSTKPRSAPWPTGHQVMDEGAGNA